MPSPLQPGSAAPTLLQPAIHIGSINEPGTLVHCRGLASGNETYLNGDEINTPNETSDNIADVGVEEREELGAVSGENPQALFHPISDATLFNDREEHVNIHQKENGEDEARQAIIKELQRRGYDLGSIHNAVDKILSALPNTILTPENVIQVLEQGPPGLDESVDIVRVGDIADTADLKKLKWENRRLREAYICKLCREENISITFRPCGHFTCCTKCFKNMKNTCNVCHQHVSSCIPVRLDV